MRNKLMFRVDVLQVAVLASGLVFRAIAKSLQKSKITKVSHILACLSNRMSQPCAFMCAYCHTVTVFTILLSSQVCVSPHVRLCVCVRVCVGARACVCGGH